MFEVKKYTQANKQDWDSLIRRSKNGTFLLYRDYMDYHADRFTDYSLLVYKRGKLEAVLPANRSGNIFYSHQGLTYGGLIQTTKLSAKDVLDIFKVINETLRYDAIEEVVYKPNPLIYHKIPSQEDIYALFRIKASKIACNLSSTIYQQNKIAFIESRKSGLRKAVAANLDVVESNDFDRLWPILYKNLEQNHGVKPVHSLDEIHYLHEKFPDNIKLYLVQKDDKTFGGTVLYLMDTIIHVQYISASEEGKFNGSLDLLFSELINNKYASVPIFDFGQSTEDSGNILNENLIFQKEGFGGRGVVYEIYKYNLK
jgi:hypothetical protein